MIERDYKVGKDYIGNVIFRDPTAEKAIGRISSERALRITELRTQLEELNRKRKNGEIPKKAFTQEREPLVEEYKALSQITLPKVG